MTCGFKDDEKKEMIYNLKQKALEEILFAEKTKSMYPLISASFIMGQLLTLDYTDKESNQLLEKLFEIARKFAEDD